MAKTFYAIFRLVFDRFIAALLLLILLPVLLLIALLVRLDGGPAFFTQMRLGKKAKPFRIYKFRSMIVNADAYLDAQGQPTRTRITRLGAFLRRSSLDELPQLINIIRGDMALIGPRPPLPHILQKMHKSEKRRFALRPGVTGLAQVLCRNQQPWSVRMKMDRLYVQRQSFCLDLFISWQTLRVVFGAKGQFLDRNGGLEDDISIR